MEMPDKHIQHILNSAKPAYDSKFWDSANAYIQLKKRKRRIGFFFWVSGISVGVGLVFFILTLNEVRPAVDTLPFIQKASENSKKYEHSDPPIAHESYESNRDLVDTPMKTEYIRQPYELASNRPKYNLNKKVITNQDQINNSTVQSALDSFTLESQAVSSNDIAIHTTSESSPFFPITIMNEHSNDESHTEQQTIIVPLNVLDQMLSPLEMEEIMLPVQTDKVSIRKQQDRLKYRGFMSSSAIFNPSWDENQLSGMGFSVGGGIEVSYARYFFGSIGLSYLHRWGTFNVMIDHPTPQYGFVKDDKGYSLVPTDAAYAELPLLAGIRFKKVGFGIGISVMRLLGAKGEVFSYQGEPDETIPGAVVYRSSPLSSGWIETPGFRNWISGLDGLIEYKLNSSFLMGCNFRVMPGGLVKGDYQFKYQNETGNYERIKTAGLLENRYHLSLFVKYML